MKLKDIKKIRIVLDNSVGIGNYKANLNVMQQLRKLGFKGIFDILYHEEMSSLAKNIICNNELMNGEDVNDPIEHATLGKITFHVYKNKLVIPSRYYVVYEEMYPELGKARALGLAKAELCVEISPDNYRARSLTDERFASSTIKELSCDEYITINPTDWCIENIKNRFVINKEKKLTILPREIRLSPVANHPQNGDLAQENLSSVEKNLLELLKKDYDFQVVYRFEAFYSKGSAYYGDIACEGVVNLFEVHHHLQQESDDKPLVLIMPFVQTLQSKKQIAKSLAKRATMSHKELHFLCLEDHPDISAEIAKRSSKGLFIVTTDAPLNQEVFNHLLKHTNFPPIIEGCNTLEYCKFHGIPHLWMLHKENSMAKYPSDDPEFIRLQDLHHKASNCLCAIVKGEKSKVHPEYFEALLEYTKLFRNKDEKLLKYHEKLAEYHLQRPEALETALETLGIEYERAMDKPAQEDMEIEEVTTAAAITPQNALKNALCDLQIGNEATEQKKDDGLPEF